MTTASRQLQISLRTAQGVGSYFGWTSGGKPYSGRTVITAAVTGLIGTASHPDMHNIRIIGFFIANRLHWQFEVEKKFLQMTVLDCIFMYVQLLHKYIIPFMHTTFGGGM
jgi:hypothetical protein